MAGEEVSIFSDLVGAAGDLFGGASSSRGNVNSEQTSTTTLSGVASDFLEISDEAIDKIIADILSSESGLGAIFNEENAAGIFNGSVAKQAAGNLIAEVTGEIAKLRAKRVQTQDQDQTTEASGSQQTTGNTEEDGLFESIGNALGF